jgi:Ca2+/Na+ antiporter
MTYVWYLFSLLLISSGLGVIITFESDLALSFGVLEICAGCFCFWIGSLDNEV